MKVSAITNFKGLNYTNLQPANQSKPRSTENKNLFLSEKSMSLAADKSYNDVFVKNKNISFTASVPAVLVEMGKQIPLADRIASLFQVFKHEEMIIVSKSLKEAQKALKTSYKSANQLFKKMFFIPDDNVGGTLAFIKHPHGETEVWNLNKENILINGRDALKPTESCYIVEGDSIKLGNFEMPVKDNPKANLSMLRGTFSTILDFEKDVKPAIEKQNLKSILAMAKDETKNIQPVMFKDVGGQDKAIDMLKKGILYPLKYPQAYKNAVVHHGALMYGPPGTGKTRLALALSNEAGVNFIKLNGSEMESKWVGQSEANWRALFDMAKEQQPSIIFIDEFDAVAKERGGQDVYGDKVVNQLLTLMSDLEKDGDQVVVITATNRKDDIDKAILRSGRFGLHIPVELPDENGLKAILNIHKKNAAVDLELDTDKLAKELYQKKATGSDIPALMTSAQANAYERCGIHKKMDEGTFVPEDLDSVKITKEDFDKAIQELFSQQQQRRTIGYTQYGK